MFRSLRIYKKPSRGKTTYNVYAKYSAPEEKILLVVSAHRDSISFLIGMKTQKLLFIIAAITYGLSIALPFFKTLYPLYLPLEYSQVKQISVFLLIPALIILACVLIFSAIITDKSHGAFDDGTGVALVLSVAEYAAKLQPKHVSVLFVFYGAEEYGLWGSRYFVASHKFDKHKTHVLHIDFLSNKQQLCCVSRIGLFKKRVCNTLLPALIENACKNYNIKYRNASAYFVPTDLLPWILNGYAGVWLYSPFEDYHSANDIPSNVNKDFLNTVGKVLQNMIDLLENTIAEK